MANKNQDPQDRWISCYLPLHSRVYDMKLHSDVVLQKSRKETELEKEETAEIFFG